MIERVIIAGAGGQGIMLIGKVLAEGAMQEGKCVTWLPAYGPEVRGGAAFCMVTISASEIGSPFIGKADTALIMNDISFTKFKERLVQNGLLVVNSSFVQAGNTECGRILAHPFTDLALKLGNIKVANMVALGCYLAYKKIIDPQTILKLIGRLAPADKKELMEINRQAFLEGMRLIQ